MDFAVTKFYLLFIESIFFCFKEDKMQRAIMKGSKRVWVRFYDRKINSCIEALTRRHIVNDEIDIIFATV